MLLENSWNVSYSNSRWLELLLIGSWFLVKSFGDAPKVQFFFTMNHFQCPTTKFSKNKIRHSSNGNYNFQYKSSFLFLPYGESQKVENLNFSEMKQHALKRTIFLPLWRMGEKKGALQLIHKGIGPNKDM
jgi:hypothetical protein